VDNIFPSRVFPNINVSDVLPPLPASLKRCSRCSTIDMWRSDFYTEDTLKELEERSDTCDFCALLYWTALRSSGNDNDEKVRFFREGSSLKRNFSKPPLLSIVTLPGKPPLLHIDTMIINFSIRCGNGPFYDPKGFSPFTTTRRQNSIPAPA
jgi:hypothetical protein